MNRLAFLVFLLGFIIPVSAQEVPAPNMGEVLQSCNVAIDGTVSALAVAQAKIDLLNQQIASLKSKLDAKDNEGVTK